MLITINPIIIFPAPILKELLFKKEISENKTKQNILQNI